MSKPTPLPDMPNIPPATVLVVDDSLSMLEVLTQQLGACGMRVRTATSGEAGVRAAAEAPPDLVLLDVLMPGINGYETCRQLKSLDATRDIPVIFMTSLDDTADTLQGFAAGGVDYLHKPVDPAELVARLRVHLLLRQRNSELAAAMERLLRSEKLLVSGKLAAAGQISTGVAHEIANPSQFATLAAEQLEQELGDVQGFLRQLAGDEADQVVMAAINERFRRLHELLATIREGTRRVHAIAQDLRVFARKDDAGEQRAQLGRMLAATVSLVRAQYLHRIEISLNLVDDPELPCSPARLGQVFMNLLVNACQAIEQQRETAPADYAGNVEVDCRIQGDELVVTCIDNGCGIPAHVHAHLFEPFYTTKPAGVGTGLGMSMAHAIVHQHHGQIGIDSSAGAGARISVRLPLRRHG